MSPAVPATASASGFVAIVCFFMQGPPEKLWIDACADYALQQCCRY